MAERRDLLRLLAAVAATGPQPPSGAAAADTAAGGRGDVGSSAGESGGVPPLPFAVAQRIWARLNADLSGRTVWFTTVGDVWGFKPQADDLRLEDFAKLAYGYAGVVARKVAPRADGALVLRQKAWYFYRDPLSGRLGDTVTNRWSGVVDTAAPISGRVSEQVLQAPPTVAARTSAKASADAGAGSSASAPSAAAARPAQADDPYHLHVRRLGSRAFVTTSSTARFKSPDIDWFKLEGNFASYHCAARDLDDANLQHVPSTYSQNLVAEWQTWTGLHGQPGHILFKGEGVALFDATEMPDDLQRAIADFFPGQLKDVQAWV